MKFFCITLAVVAASCSALAGVIDVSDQFGGLDVEVAAADSISGLPSKSVRCGGSLPRNGVFAVNQMRGAAEATLDHLLRRTQVGNANKFPKVYGYRDPTVRFPDARCSHNDVLYEFPIARGLFNGGDVTNLPQRVVIKRNGKKGVYCGLMTHECAPAAPGVNAPYTSCSG